VPVKLLMSWDILPGREQDYFEFVVRDFIPGVQKLGLQPSDAWYTYYGDHPQILAGFTMKELIEMEQVLDSQEWQELNRQLLDYVEDLDFKIVRARGGFQL